MKNKKNKQLVEPTFMTADSLFLKDVIFLFCLLFFVGIFMMFGNWIFDIMPVK